MVRHWDRRPDLVKLSIRVYDEGEDISTYNYKTKVSDIIKMLMQRHNLEGVFMLYGTLNAKKTKDVMYVLEDNDKLFFQALRDSRKKVFKRDEILRLIDELESKFTYKTWGGSKKLELDRDELFWWLDENEGNFTLPKVHYQNGVAVIKRGKEVETVTRISKVPMDLSAMALASKYKKLFLRNMTFAGKSMQALQASFSYTDHTKWVTKDVGA